MSGRHRDKLGWFARRRLRLDNKAHKRADERIRNAWNRFEWQQAAFERSRMPGDDAGIDYAYPNSVVYVRQPYRDAPTSEAWDVWQAGQW